ncbi:MAG TPA: ParA family protein [Anaerolineae bacterium]|nr:ParA family protein [Anaerolineae bacterium]
MGHVIAVANQKGGVGKTTTAINLGAALAEKGKRTLLVDLDPQGALSNGLGIPSHALDRTVYHVLVNSNLPVAAVIHRIRPSLDVIPSNVHLAAAEVELISMADREFRLATALKGTVEQYDYTLIDCGPSLGLLTVNALTAADAVLIPLQCEYLALRGVGMLLDTIGKVKARLNPKLRLLGILGTMYNSRTVHAREVMEEVRQMFGPRVFKTVVRASIRFAEAPAAHLPILDYAPNHPGALAYRALAEEIIHDEETKNVTN